MAIKGITFDYQKPTAKAHGALFANIIPDSRISGCTLSYSGANITIGAGYLIVAGREIHLDAAITQAITEQSGYARLVCGIDLSGTATASAFEQVSFSVDYPASVTDPNDGLTQGAINAGSDSIYQVAVGIFSVASSTVSGQVYALPMSSYRLLGENDYGTALPTAGNAGRIFFKKVSS